jgi:hypothetical protein
MHPLSVENLSDSIPKIEKVIPCHPFVISNNIPPPPGHPPNIDSHHHISSSKNCPQAQPWNLMILPYTYAHRVVLWVKVVSLLRYTVRWVSRGRRDVVSYHKWMTSYNFFDFGVTCSTFISLCPNIRNTGLYFYLAFDFFKLRKNGENVFSQGPT